MAAAERAREPVLVFGYGNPSRGDDAIGPLLIERLDRLRLAGRLAGVDLLTDFQLQVEHALDLCGRERVIFVDAAVDQPEPLCWADVRPETDPAWSSHSLSPGAVAAVYRTLYGPPPPMQLLAVQGESFALGAGLSAAGERNLEAALRALLDALSPGPPRAR
jgi:hydrogenase maturation protease